MDSTTTDAHAQSEQTSIDDWRALGDLIEMATDRLSAPAEGVHGAITDRWFGLAGIYETRGHTTHKSLTGTLYNSVRVAGTVARKALDVGATTIGRHRDVRPLWSSPAGAAIQATANALWGDDLHQQVSPMTTGTSVRDSDGMRIGTDATSMAEAFPSPTRRLAVFLHGLGKTERCWHTKATDTGGQAGMAAALEEDLFTPMLVRYNSGRRVSDNGVALASLLEDVSTNWPVEVDEIVLVGHSMGGLIARSSLHAGVSEDHSWVNSVQHVVTLGTPHFGSPIEKGVHIASRVLDQASEGRPLSRFLDSRSGGIKDMRHGSISDGKACEQAPGLTNEYAQAVPPVDGVRHHHAASVVTNAASHPLGFLVGDLVVRVNSALGIGSHGRVPASNVRVFEGQNHLGMLHDPSVHSQVRDWLTPSRLDARTRLA